MTQEDDLIKSIKRHLDESADHLDAPTLASIAAARAQALEAKPPWRLTWFWPALGLSAAVGAILAFFIATHLTPGPRLTAEHQEALEIIASGNNLELYRNLEFYAWLGQYREVPPGG